MSKVAMDLLIILRRIGGTFTIGSLCMETGKSTNQIRGTVTALREQGLVTVDENQAPYVIALTKAGLEYELPGTRMNSDPIIHYRLVCQMTGKLLTKHTNKLRAFDAADKRDAEMAPLYKTRPYLKVQVFAKHRSGQTTGPVERD